MLITLQDWAHSKYATPPKPATLRKWARCGNIQPAPVLTGRQYMVEETAEYTPEPPQTGIAPDIAQRLRELGRPDLASGAF